MCSPDEYKYTPDRAFSIPTVLTGLDFTLGHSYINYFGRFNASTVGVYKTLFQSDFTNIISRHQQVGVCSGGAGQRSAQPLQSGAHPTKPILRCRLGLAFSLAVSHHWHVPCAADPCLLHHHLGPITAQALTRNIHRGQKHWPPTIRRPPQLAASRDQPTSVCECHHQTTWSSYTVCLSAPCFCSMFLVPLYSCRHPCLLVRQLMRGTATQRP